MYQRKKDFEPMTKADLDRINDSLRETDRYNDIACFELEDYEWMVAEIRRLQSEASKAQEVIDLVAFEGKIFADVSSHQPWYRFIKKHDCRIKSEAFWNLYHRLNGILYFK